MVKGFLQSLTVFTTACAALVLMGADGRVISSGTGSHSAGAASSAAPGSETVRSKPSGSVSTGSTTSVPGAPAKNISSSVTCSAVSKPTCSIVSGGTTTHPAKAPHAPVTAPTATAETLSPAAEEIAHEIGFDRRVLLMVKAETQERIQRLIGYDADGYQIMAQGIAASIPEDKTDHVLSRLRRQLAPMHYIPFVVEMNEGIKTDKIGVLKGTDQLEILRIMNTNGNDYDISNEDVIEQLQEWEKVFSFEIVGADNDWVEIEFKTLPKDMKAFAEDVYAFSPDAVDQGPGTVDGLIREIRKTNRLFLWWE